MTVTCQRLTLQLLASGVLLAAASCGGADIAAPTGAIEIVTTTSGPNPDPDGYSVAVDAGATQTIGANATLTVPGVTSGAHQITLTGLAANCTVADDNPLPVTVSPGATAAVTFTINCSETQPPTLAFASDRDAHGPNRQDIYILKPDGGSIRLTRNSGFSISAPAWSPDGSRIVFSGSGEIFVVNVGGSSLINVTNHPETDRTPTWSPDGNEIAFSSYREGGCCSDIFVMNADGSDVRNLSNDLAADFESSPSWSPDGRNIAFRREQGAWSPDVAIIAADGSGPSLPVPGSEGFDTPQWSPDGSRITFSRGDDYDFAIYSVRSDGSEPTLLTSGPCSDPSGCTNVGPVFSPDGRKIAFVSNRDQPEGFSSDTDIYIMNVDGSGVARLTNAPGRDNSPKWSPDGEKIAFVSERDGNAEVYIMNTDGSGQTNVTNSPANDWGPSWSP